MPDVVRIDKLGVWTNLTAYAVNDMTTYAGIIYICNVANRGERTNATLLRSGAGTLLSPWTLGLNLGNSNEWTVGQSALTLTAGSSLLDDLILIDPPVKGANQFTGTITSTDLTAAEKKAMVGDYMKKILKEDIRAHINMAKQATATEQAAAEIAALDMTIEQ
jgi:hypothetical protein